MEEQITSEWLGDHEAHALAGMMNLNCRGLAE
jgi:hypothetical protein